VELSVLGTVFVHYFLFKPVYLQRIKSSFSLNMSQSKQSEAVPLLRVPGTFSVNIYTQNVCSHTTVLRNEELKKSFFLEE